MAESLTLPLRSGVSRGPEHDSLQLRIFQIYSQKGAFRDITEKSLIQDVEFQKQGDMDVEMAEAEETEKEAESRYELMIKAREEMMQQLR